METHRFPFSITHQRSAANGRHVLINIFNVKIINIVQLLIAKYLQAVTKHQQPATPESVPNIKIIIFIFCFIFSLF